MARGGSKQKALNEMVAPLAKAVEESKKRQGAKIHSPTEPANDGSVNEFAAQHGRYDRNMRFVTNRGGTAIDRWRGDGNMSDSQLAAVLHCQVLWNRIGSRSIIADFDRVSGGDNGHFYTEGQYGALMELGRIAAEFPATYWDVFENVCRHDLPAGVAGSRLANVKRHAEVAARCVVCFVADIIAMKERLSY